MLSRVSAALSNFIQPVSDSLQHSIERRPGPRDQQASKEGFKRFDRGKDPESQQKQPQAAPAPAPAPAPVIPLRPAAASPQSASASAAPSPSVTHSFVQLLAAIHTGRVALIRWIGQRAYAGVAKTRRRGKLRKGAMIDFKAE